MVVHHLGVEMLQILLGVRMGTNGVEAGPNVVRELHHQNFSSLDR